MSGEKDRENKKSGGRGDYCLWPLQHTFWLTVKIRRGFQCFVLGDWEQNNHNSSATSEVSAWTGTGFATCPKSWPSQWKILLSCHLPLILGYVSIKQHWSSSPGEKHQTEMLRAQHSLTLTGFCWLKRWQRSFTTALPHSQHSSTLWFSAQCIIVRTHNLPAPVPFSNTQSFSGKALFCLPLHNTETYRFLLGIKEQ